MMYCQIIGGIITPTPPQIAHVGCDTRKIRNRFSTWLEYEAEVLSSEPGLQSCVRCLHSQRIQFELG